MVTLNPQERKKCSVIASSLAEYEAQILDLEPFTVVNQSYRPSQRLSQGPTAIYNQPPPGYRPPEVQQVVMAPSYLSYQQQQQHQQPKYYQGSSYTHYQQPQQGQVYQKAMY